MYVRSSFLPTQLFPENLLRYDKKPIFGSVASKYTNCLGAVVRHAALSSLVVDRNVVKEHTINLISGISNNIVLLDFSTFPFLATSLMLFLFQLC